MNEAEILEALHDAAEWHGNHARLYTGMARAELRTRRGAALPAGGAAALAAQHARYARAIELAMQCAHAAG